MPTMMTVTNTLDGTREIPVVRAFANGAVVACDRFWGGVEQTLPELWTFYVYDPDAKHGDDPRAACRTLKEAVKFARKL